MTSLEIARPPVRTLLVLGRVSNLPTVWSNCIAGWWLGGGGNLESLPIVMIAVSFLYVGGMFLNDAFDVEFDRQYRMERPIPAGAISLKSVLSWGLVFLGTGGICLIALGLVTGLLGLVLLISILVYDAFHKKTKLAPLLMGFCRLLVYLIASSIARDGVTGYAMWCGIALGLFVVGLSYFAREESRRGHLKYWPISLLAMPIALGLVMNTNEYREAGLLLSAVLALWIIMALRRTMFALEPNVGRTVSFLLAGIVLVDWLAVADAPRHYGIVFILLFIGALLGQRFIPAT